MPYQIPPEEDVIEATKKIMEERGIVNSQKKLHGLVVKELKKMAPDFKLSEERLRIIALSMDSISIDIYTRESEEESISLEECPVCYGEMKQVRNETIYGWKVTLGKVCKNCPYWTGRKKKIPTRYVFKWKES